MSMPNHPLWERPLLGLTAIKYLGILCSLYALWRLSTTGRIPAYLQGWQARFFLLLVSVATLSYFFQGEAAGIEFSPISIYGAFVVFFFVLVSVIDSFRKLRVALLCAIGSTAITSLYVIREFQKS